MKLENFLLDKSSVVSDNVLDNSPDSNSDAGFKTPPSNEVFFTESTRIRLDIEGFVRQRTQ